MAIVLFAARDYVDARRWMIANGHPINASAEIDRLHAEKQVELNRDRYRQAREIQRQINDLKPQSDREEEVKRITEFFLSKYYSNISPIDGREFLQKLEERLTTDKNFRIKVCDFNEEGEH